MKILIANVYSYKNKGDAAIVISLIEEIRRIFGDDARVVAQTADINNDEGKYGVPVVSSLLWTLLSKVRTQNIAYRLWILGSGVLSLLTYKMLYRVLGAKADVLLNKDLRDYVKDLQSSDIIIGCGGGYLRTSDSGLENAILLYVTCLNMAYAKTFGKKVYLYSQSIGPVHGKLQKRMLRWLLSYATIIEPREKVSVDYLKSLGVDQSKVHETADPVLLLGGMHAGYEPRVPLKEGKMHVGMTVRKWFNNDHDLEDYITAMAGAIDYLIEEHNAEVFYLPQVIAANFGDDDRLIAERVRTKVHNAKFFTLIDQDMHPYEIINFCAKMHIFIGTRMHSNIFSLINHVPVVAIEYEHKTRGIMRGLGIEELTLPIGDVDTSLLVKTVDGLLDNRDAYSAKIKMNMPSEIAKSRKAIELIHADYAQKVA